MSVQSPSDVDIIASKESTLPDRRATAADDQSLQPTGRFIVR